jgi:hypothetical protein
MTHCLKTWPEYYKSVIDGSKPFEVRQNDRSFHVGDTLILQEYDPEKKQYTGQETEFSVTYILVGGAFGVEDGYVVMGLRQPERYV